MQTEEVGKDWNRTGGLEFNYLSENGKWNGEVGYHQSFMPDQPNDSHFVRAMGQYNGRKVYFYQELFQVGANYNAEMGFTPRIENYDPVLDSIVRIGYMRSSTWASYSWYPQDKAVVYHGPRMSHQMYFDEDGQISERHTSLIYELDMANQSQIDFGITNSGLTLFHDFDILGNDDPLKAGDYSYYQALF